MGCGQKSWHEDEEAWDAFKTNTELKVSWKENSREATAAKMAFKLSGSTGSLLKLDVLQLMEAEDLFIRHRSEREAFVAAQELLKKYT